MQHSDILIAGAGVIGVSIALELARRGLSVSLLSEGEPLAHASTAAAGMLALDDPENPAALQPLATLSRELYPSYLDHISTAGRCDPMVSFQTTETLQAREPDVDRIAAPAPVPLSASALRSVQPGLRAGSRSFVLLEEASLDPRELAAATAAALARSPFIHLHKPVRALEVATGAAGVTVNTTAGALQTGWFVDCTGAWSIPSVAGSCVPVHPRKGQILSVSIPPELSLTRVIRTSEVYIVPRLHGPRAGEAIVGATVEDRGFDVTVEKHAIAGLHSRAAALLPALASAPITRAWAGLRPATPDGLPVLGWTGERTLVAKGHFRNGILLAPATAQILADLITGGQPSVDLAPFAPGRAVSPLPGARASNHPSLSEDDATAVCDNGFIATL